MSKTVTLSKLFTRIFTMLSLLVYVLPGCTPEHTHQVLSADNVPIIYHVQGKGKPALVFVHGWCCDKSYWKFQVPHFAAQHKVVTIDLAGHGESGIDRKNWTIEAFGKDVVAVIENLGLDQVILIGHSMGGSVIMEAARQISQPILGLVGVDTYHDFEEQYTQQQINKFIFPFKVNFAEKTSNFVRSAFTSKTDPALVEQIVTDMSSAPPEVGIGAMQGLFDFDSIQALKEVRIPIVCINSDKYPTNIDAGKRHALSFEIKLMPGIGHFVMLEDPETFNQLLTETVNELSSGGVREVITRPRR